MTLREALHAELHPHKTFDAFDCRCAEIAERLAALAAPAAEPRPSPYADAAEHARQSRNGTHLYDDHCAFCWFEAHGPAAAQPGPSEPGLREAMRCAAQDYHELALRLGRPSPQGNHDGLTFEACPDVRCGEYRLAAADSAPGLRERMTALLARFRERGKHTASGWDAVWAEQDAWDKAADELEDALAAADSAPGEGLRDVDFDADRMTHAWAILEAEVVSHEFPDGTRGVIPNPDRWEPDRYNAAAFVKALLKKYAALSEKHQEDRAE